MEQRSGNEEIAQARRGRARGQKQIRGARGPTTHLLTYYDGNSRPFLGEKRLLITFGPTARHYHRVLQYLTWVRTVSTARVGTTLGLILWTIYSPVVQSVSYLQYHLETLATWYGYNGYALIAALKDVHFVLYHILWSTYSISTSPRCGLGYSPFSIYNVVLIVVLSTITTDIRSCAPTSTKYFTVRSSSQILLSYMVLTVVVLTWYSPPVHLIPSPNHLGPP